MRAIRKAVQFLQTSFQRRQARHTTSGAWSRRPRGIFETVEIELWKMDPQYSGRWRWIRRTRQT